MLISTPTLGARPQRAPSEVSRSRRPSFDMLGRLFRLVDEKLALVAGVGGWLLSFEGWAEQGRWASVSNPMPVPLGNARI
jgi:hypothetical protein